MPVTGATLWSSFQPRMSRRCRKRLCHSFRRFVLTLARSGPSTPNNDLRNHERSEAESSTIHTPYALHHPHNFSRFFKSRHRSPQSIEVPIVPSAFPISFTSSALRLQDAMAIFFIDIPRQCLSPGLRCGQAFSPVCLVVVENDCATVFAASS